MEVVWIIIGVVIGIAMMYISNRIRSTSGTLRIDHTNPDKDVYRFEINNLDALAKKKRVILEIDHDAVLSQK